MIIHGGASDDSDFSEYSEEDDFDEEEYSDLPEYSLDFLLDAADDDERLLKYFWRRTYAKAFKGVIKEPNTENNLLLDDLKLALKRDNPSLVEKFFKSGVDLKTTLDKNGWTVLDYAVAYAANLSLKFILSTSLQNDLSVDVEVGDLLLQRNETKTSECSRTLEGFGVKHRRATETVKPAEEDEEDDGMFCKTENHLGMTVTVHNATSLFLSNNDLSPLVPLFKDMPFHEFLRLSDEDLEKMGVYQFGYRRKILRSVREFHTLPWNISSLGFYKTAGKFRSSDLLKLFMNMKFQLDVMGSSQHFVRQSIRNSKCDDPKKQEKLQLMFLQTRKNLEVLRDEVVAFKENVDKICAGRAMDPPHFIECYQKRSWGWMRWLVGVSLSLAAMFAVHRMVKHRNV